MRFNIAGVVCVALIATNIGISIGLVGQTGESYVCGWDHVATIAIGMITTALLGYMAGRGGDKE